jgi:tetratricopeptide (TPR) repeat protein
MSGSALQEGLRVVKEAVAADQAGQVAQAVQLYEQALMHFQVAAQEESNPSLRALLSTKVHEYSVRVSTLRPLVSLSSADAHATLARAPLFPPTPSTGHSQATASPPAPSLHPMIALYALKHPSSRPNLQAALDLAELAQAEDKKKNYQAALDLYTDVLERFMVCLQGS